MREENAAPPKRKEQHHSRGKMQHHTEGGSSAPLQRKKARKAAPPTQRRGMHPRGGREGRGGLRPSLLWADVAFSLFPFSCWCFPPSSLSGGAAFSRRSFEWCCLRSLPLSFPLGWSCFPPPLGGAAALLPSPPLPRLLNKICTTQFTMDTHMKGRRGKATPPKESCVIPSSAKCCILPLPFRVVLSPAPLFGVVLLSPLGWCFFLLTAFFNFPIQISKVLGASGASKVEFRNSR